MDGVVPEALNRIPKLFNNKYKYSDNELFYFEYDGETPLVRQWADLLYTFVFNLNETSTVPN